ncbi:MAG: hypothetical protein KY444_03300, partial [Gemmatimonadetes bacterium]|nr:hypothetical protein [Gemmatimonadota bacterium]
DLTYLALNIGRLGFQLSSSGRGRFDLSPLAAELILFGNAGRTGEAQSYNLQNSGFTTAATSTAALSYAQPLSLPGRGRLSVGATAKYTVGHALAAGRDAGTQATANPLAVSLDFPIIQTDTTLRFGNGSGIGLDLGAAYQAGPLTVSAAVQNVFNTFRWDDGKLLYRRGRAFFDADSASTDFTAQGIDQAPANVPGLRELRAYVQDLGFPPVLVAGAAFRTSPRLLLSADVRHAFGQDLRLGPQTHVGAGVEFAPVPVLPLRAGAAAVSGGYMLGAGAGLRLGRVNLSGAYGRRESGDFGTDSQFMFTLSFGREPAQQQ